MVVIEQTETPEQLKSRNAGLKGTGQKQVTNLPLQLIQQLH